MAKSLEREAPAPEPLAGGLDGPSHPNVSDEPVLNINNIQGNSLAGFNKDHQLLLFFRVDDPGAFRTSLADLVPMISTLGEVNDFNRLFKSMRARLGRDPDMLKATWTNIGFTFHGLKRIADGNTTIDFERFEDKAFKQGLVASSASLGDPLEANAEGNPNNWRVLDGDDDGAHDAMIAHMVVIIAGDDLTAVTTQKTAITGMLKGVTQLSHSDVGENLSGALHGHEHFKFLDGVSQPGVRGRVSEDPRSVLTPRQNPNNRHQGKPGQELIWPGEFVFGYPGQEGNPDNDPKKSFQNAGPVSFAGLEWANDGSFLVFRRLRQDVGLFHRFLNEKATNLNVPAPDGSAAADLVGSRLVGRWRSGAPVLRSPDKDNSSLGNDDCANNNFEFQETTEPLPQTAEDDPFDCTDAVPNSSPAAFFDSAKRDRKGLVCPFSAHIRKAYPRDDEALGEEGFTKLNGDFVRTTDVSVGEGEPNEGDKIKLNEDDTQSHRILRRGIPFGEASQSLPGNPKDDGVDRGLLFISYQTSIEDQFEFIIKNWVNNPNFKELFNGGQPQANLRSGHDPIIGQTNEHNRIREFTVTFRDPGTNQIKAERVTTDDGAGKGRDWVISTGGGYFFSPSIEGLKHLADL